MKIVIFILMVFFVKKVEGQIDLHKSVSECTIINPDSLYYILTKPAQLEKGYQVRCDSILYDIVLSQENVVKYISTSDKKFKTSDGLTVKNTFGDIKADMQKSSIYNFRGWGKFIELKSGWFAVFNFKKSLTKNSRIQFFFKR